MLLNLTRRHVGEGLGPIVNNHPITLNRDARILAGQSTCYADILFPDNDLPPAIDIELQGHMPITLNRDARILAGQSTCYADILFPDNDLPPAIDIELQGHMVHDGGRAGGIDSSRMLGLKRMGIEVIMVTAEQHYNPPRFQRLWAPLSSLRGNGRTANSAGL